MQDVVSRRGPELEMTINHAADVILRLFSRHWLAVVNAMMLTYVGLATAAPLMMASGITLPAQVVYLLFRPICNQLPTHSYFVYGHQMACCERCLAIYGSILVGGLLFLIVRGWLRQLPFKVYLALIVPMAIDGLTQLFGLRESTWEIRTATGGLFGLATVWLVFPPFHQTMTELRVMLARPAGVLGVGKA